ncbi:hypothetical protein [Pedobacter steynii]
METSGNNNSKNKGAKDKLHLPDLGETRDFDNLSFNEEKRLLK